MKNLLKLKLFLILFIFTTNNQVMAINANSYNNNLQILNKKDGKILANFRIRIASDKSIQEQGLMNVESLPENFGLLFKFEREKIASMWMKDTLIPLDMIFIDSSNRVESISKSTTPLSKKLIFSQRKVKYVLEINAGLSELHDIKVGDFVKIY